MIQWFKDVLYKSWIVKVLLLLLMLSFGIWGIGDFITPGMDPRIAVSVGKTDITLDEVQRRFSQQLDNMKQSIGPIDSDQIKRSILDSTVQNMTRETTMDLAAQDLGLVVSTERLRNLIREDPNFKDESGRFSAFIYGRILQENRLTEAAFIKLYTADLRQRELLKAAVNNSATPNVLTDALFAYRGEMRVADTLLITTASVPAPAKLSDEELKKVYGNNIVTFTAPEYRKVKAVALSSDDLFSADSLTEEQLKAYYNENADRYRTHETRQVAQIVFDTKEQAEAARAMATSGDRLDEVAKKAKTSVVDMGQMTKTSPLVKTMGAAYDLPAGEISQPVQSDLGWHLFEVKSITPEVVRTYESVRDEVRKTIAADKGTDALYDASQALEDAITAGEPVEDVAQKVNGKLIVIETMDENGRDPRGVDVKGLIDNDRFISTAFSVPSGSESKLIEIPKGYYMLKVEGVTPPTAKPFEDVRNEVAALAEKQKRLETAREIAAKLAAEITPATSMASKGSASYAQLGPINRFGEAPSRAMITDSARISPDVLEEIFKAKGNDVVTAPVVDGIVVARLREVRHAAETEIASQRAQMSLTLRDAIADNLAQAMTQAFSTRYPVELNHSALDTLATSAR